MKTEDTEDWSNDAEITDLHQGINLIIKTYCKQIKKQFLLNCKNISQYYFFTCIFNLNYSK